MLIVGEEPCNCGCPVDLFVRYINIGFGKYYDCVCLACGEQVDYNNNEEFIKIRCGKELAKKIKALYVN